MLHQEAGLAHEFAGALGLDAIDRITAVIDLYFFFILVGLFLRGNQAILQNGVEVGFDVIGIDDVVIVVLLFGGGESAGGGSRFLLDVFDIVDDTVVVTDECIIFLVDLKVFFVQIVGIDQVVDQVLLFEFDFFFGDFVFISHDGAASYGVPRRKAPHHQAAFKNITRRVKILRAYCRPERLGPDRRTEVSPSK